jgi:tRNA modification GTPase
LHDNAGDIEGEGIRRALARAEHADLKLLVFDGARWPVPDEATARLADERAIAIINKSDLIGDQGSGVGDQKIPLQPLFLSAQTGAGIPALLERLAHEIDLRFADAGLPPLTRARHRAALEDALSHLERALAATEAELRAEDARLAMRALGRITGRVDVEDLLDIIFRDFCIGK